jgi:hypothetical protein
MRVFWWQGGLHAEPENDVETEALLVLLHGMKYGRPPGVLDGPPVSGTADASDLDLNRGQGEGGLDVGQ